MDLLNELSQKLMSVQKVNERALRFVYNQNKGPTQKLLNKIALPSLENQRLAKIVCTVFNVNNNQHAPKSIKELIDKRSVRSTMTIIFYPLFTQYKLL